MDIEKLKEVLQRRIRISEELHGCDYGLDEVWAELCKIATDDFDGFSSFLVNKATEAEFLYISEIFEDLAGVYGKEKVLPIFREAVDKYPEISREYYIYGDLKDIEEQY